MGEIAYLAQQLVDVPVVLGYAFDKLIETLNEISNLIPISIAKGARPQYNIHPRNKDRSFVTTES